MSLQFYRPTVLHNTLQARTATGTQNKDDAKRFANLIGPMDTKLDREVRELLVTARVSLLLKSSFFGNLATRLKLVNADEWCATAATDGRHFYYNTRFIKMLRPREIEFLFGHEVLHCVYDHFGRRGERDPQIWNIANDYCVNGDLKKHRVGEFITSVPCLYDAKYDGKSSEEVYDDLMKNVQQVTLDQLINQLLDDHLDGEGEGDSGGSGSGDQKGKGRPQLTEEEKQQIRDEIKEAVISAAQTCGAGELPAGVKRMIRDLTEPKMNWRELIRQQIQSTIKSDFTFMRASRKGWHMDAIMPGMKTTDAIDIVCFLDMSGSIGEEQARDFISEIKGIMETFENYRVHIACFDTKVYNPQQYNSENLEDIAEYELAGGGGTDFECMFRYLKDAEIEPKKLIVFTDGYPCGSWGDPNYCDTTWIIHGDPNPNPPFGVFALYDDHR
jgi:predicted metal-dependent peptidase